jgi:membrane carboxypeptidase/penicillin-binding protein
VSAELPVVPSLVLGSGDVSPLDMAVGYSTFANRGVHNDPAMIVKIEQVVEGGDVQVLDEAINSDSYKELMTNLDSTPIKLGPAATLEFIKKGAATYERLFAER